MSVLEPLQCTGTCAHLDLLEQELERATVVDSRELAPHVVSMNSEFVYEELGTCKRHRARLVYPGDADVDRAQISVFAPLGSALLGLHAGQEIRWAVPNGIRHLKLIEVCYQPEAAGHWSL